MSAIVIVITATLVCCLIGLIVKGRKQEKHHQLMEALQEKLKRKPVEIYIAAGDDKNMTVHFEYEYEQEGGVCSVKIETLDIPYEPLDTFGEAHHHLSVYCHYKDREVGNVFV